MTVSRRRFMKQVAGSLAAVTLTSRGRAAAAPPALRVGACPNSCSLPLQANTALSLLLGRDANVGDSGLGDFSDEHRLLATAW